MTGHPEQTKVNERRSPICKVALTSALVLFVAHTGPANWFPISTIVGFGIILELLAGGFQGGGGVLLCTLDFSVLVRR